MLTHHRPAAPPSDDKRWRVVEGTMRRHGHAPDALIETLHTVQESFGCLEPEGLRFVAESLGVPLSKVFGVATFYHLFTLKPPGKHTCVVCTGTACYIGGGRELASSVEGCTGIHAGETTGDGEISYLTARCLGACSQAPVVVFDGEMLSHAEEAEVVERLRGWQRHDG